MSTPPAPRRAPPVTTDETDKEEAELILSRQRRGRGYAATKVAGQTMAGNLPPVTGSGGGNAAGLGATTVGQGQKLGA
jgi:hypothetical protein